MKNYLFTLGLLAAAMTFSACGEEKDDPTPPPTPPEPEIEITVPTVVTGEVADVTDISATASISLTSDGGATITALGLVWDQEANPTADLPTKITFEGTEDDFTCELTELTPSTTYYYRAFATNEAGTAYGEERSFTTSLASTLSVAVNDLVIDMILVEGGTFQMGATEELRALASNDPDELPVHEVTLDSYYIGKFEVSQALWIEIMGSNPSALVKNNECPVDFVSQLQCLQFIEKLNERTGLTFSLPTEAQWEFAARGGNKSEGYVYSGSNDATEVGWVLENMVTFGQQPCGQKAPNELGIYDMTGNVNEWTADVYDTYPEEPQVNPTGPEPYGNSTNYVVRGGAYTVESERWCRNTKRIRYPAQYVQMDIGMRLALNIDTTTEE